MRFMIVDDHEVVREGILASLSSEDGFDCVGAVGTGGEALEHAQRTEPDVVLVDLRLPDMTGEQVCESLRVASPRSSVVVLSTYLNEAAVRGALRAGACAYVTKAAGMAKLRETLHAVVSDRYPALKPQHAPQIVEQLHGLVANRMGGPRPTPQQERILELAADGLTNREIGEQLFISESTVRFHLSRLREIFDAHTKTELIAKAIRAGAIQIAPEDRPGS